MASRSARSPRAARPIEDLDEEGGLGSFLAEHRFAVGGVTAFAVAFSYVAANAIWYQPHAHGSAFFATRPLVSAEAAQPSPPAATGADDVETVIRLERDNTDNNIAAVDTTPTPAAAPVKLPEVAPASIPAPPAPAAADGDPIVADVQRILAELNLYEGAVDGLTGPQTRAAIEDYRKTVGLSVSAEIDDQLLAQLGATPRSQSSAAPLPEGSPGTDLIETSSAGAPESDPMVLRIQAGLKAFGNDAIEVDGVVGPRTTSAILEFQSLFGLPETGEPNQALLTKMRDIGLTD
ncbi:peptidoglycan-binding domain-containing protein [Mesorhizobium sp. CAU 1741]|uniref:peptidoglycan-binding domain-containing protein n=1 Tax=Mesorhizobium sp. CAU 1741 TaxID=3140366 RepID=UPI00325B448A